MGSRRKKAAGPLMTSWIYPGPRSFHFLEVLFKEPEIVPGIVEKESARSPEDIRGVGEPATIPTAAAVANAVYDAVGVRVNDLPLTPEKVYRALKGKRGGEWRKTIPRDFQGFHISS
jgi:hypothetical protein